MLQGQSSNGKKSNSRKQRHKKGAHWDNIRKSVGSLFRFSNSEWRGILWFLPLLIVVGLIIYAANRPTFEKSFLEMTDRVEGDGQSGGVRSGGRSDSGTVGEGGVGSADKELDLSEYKFFRFDPNTVTIQELVRLGFTPRTAAGIIKYRERGKRFEIPEDFATCYGVTIEHYTALEPYIQIGAEYGVTKGERHPKRVMPDPKSNESIGLESFDPNELDGEGFVRLGFSLRQAEVIINFRNIIGGFRTVEDFERCYAVSEQSMERLRPFVRIAEKGADETAEKQPSPYKEPIEINGADSLTLRRISGVGEVLVGRIMEYRQRLGGFVTVGQLAEVRGMSENNFERICKQIWVDSCEIKKIDVNFATHKTLVEGLGNHPYIPAKTVRKLLKQRQLRGGWSKLEDLVNENIVTQEEAMRLAPYLLFGTVE